VPHVCRILLIGGRKESLVSSRTVGNPEVIVQSRTLGQAQIFTVFTKIVQFWVWHLVVSCDGLWNQNPDKCLSFQALPM